MEKCSNPNHRRYRAVRKPLTGCKECWVIYENAHPNFRTHKTCSICKEEKGLEHFHKRSRHCDGYEYCCIPCKALRHKEHVTSYSPEKLEQYHERRRKCSREWFQKLPDKRKFYLLGQYGLSIGEYDKMYSSQEGRCAICNDDLIKPFVDHCHNSNKVRGLLCRGCNTGLGFFKDSVENLEKAAKYIQQAEIKDNISPDKETFDIV